MSELAAACGAIAALVAAVAASWRSMALGSLLRNVRRFLLDWNGEDARPGVPARPSFPERMAALEDRTDLTERRTADLSHELRGEMLSRLTLLAEGQQRMHARDDDVASRLTRLDERVSDHRRRNEQQIELLRAEVNDRLRNISGDLLRAETYRAALTELGLDIEPSTPTHRLEDPE